MTTLIQALRTALISDGMTNVFIATAPDITPCVLLTPYGSNTETDIPLGQVSIQCHVRSDTYTESEALAWQAFLAIVESKPTCDRTVKSIVPRQEPFFLGIDEGNKFVHVFNFDVLAIWKERG